MVRVAIGTNGRPSTCSVLENSGLAKRWAECQLSRVSLHHPRKDVEVNGEKTQVLVVCGASGTGKTATVFEVGQHLRTLGIQHALIDTDELDRIWPQPEQVDDLIEISRQNLRAMWMTFSGLGVRHLVLCGVMASISESRLWIADAIGDSTITYVRLTAEQTTRENRPRGREIGSGFKNDIVASDGATAFIENHDPPSVPRVPTDGKSVVTVSAEVLRAADWFDSV